MKVYDISEALREGMPVWPGDCAFSHRWTMRQDRGESCNVSAVTMSVHSGTHVDAPYHFESRGAGIGSVPLRNYIGPVRVFEVGPVEYLTAGELEKLVWGGVERALFKTRKGPPSPGRFSADFCHLTEGAAEFLGGLDLLLVGIDTPSIDAFDSRTLRAHHILLSRDIAILEGARLEEVPPGDYELICLPLKFEGLDGSPVRAVVREL